MEVLAHIGAPSGKKDDDRYEAQARAYASFHSGNSVNLSKCSNEVSFSGDEEETAELPESSDDQSLDFIEDTQLAVAALETDLLTSSLQELLEDDTQPTVGSAQVAGLENYQAHRSPSTQIPCSNQNSILPSPEPWENEELRACSHTNVRYQQTPYMAIREGNSFGVAFIGTLNQTKDTIREASEGEIEGCAASRILESQREHECLLPADRQKYKVKNDRNVRHLHRNKSTLSGNLLNQIESNMAEGQENTTERMQARLEHGEEQYQVPQASSTMTDPKGKTTDVHSDPSPTAQSQSPSQSTKKAEEPSIDFRGQPFYFTVENPPIGVSKEIPSQFNEAATTIKKLPTIPELEGKYNPQERLRDLGRFERAKWTVDTSRWTPQLQLEFWEWLQKHGKPGRLGWNITFWREHDDGADEETRCNSLGTVTVFCWPEVVEHIYLALYVASRSRIVGTGATLRTAAKSELVVQMG